MNVNAIVITPQTPHFILDLLIGCTDFSFPLLCFHGLCISIPSLYTEMYHTLFPHVSISLNVSSGGIIPVLYSVGLQ